MAVRMPGADSLEELHTLLAKGFDGVRPVDPERLALAGLDPDGAYQNLGAIRGIEEFDHEFFGLTPAEAAAMDPHQRLTLQLACTAVENAGYRLSALRGSACGVFLSAAQPEYARLVGDGDLLTMLGTSPSAIAGRIAYLLGLHGPALVLDTGCSSSLVALHYACRELAAGAVDLALAGGLSVVPVPVERSEAAAFAEVMAPDGVCRAFDAAAAGTSSGEGGAVLLLKLLDRAVADRDTIHAVVRGVAINHNGQRSNGFAAPGLTAQVEVIEQAWRLAGLGIDRLSVLEAHGSGTRLGDMIEIEAAQRVLRSAGAGRHACAIGSVKTNFGHLGNAAGVAGLVKAVLGVRNRMLYPSLNFERPNPQLAQHGEPVYVSTEARPWDGPGLMAAGVSSFTLIGTNAHVVVEQPPPVGTAGAPVRPDLATVSARTPAALSRMLRALGDWLPGMARDDLADALFVLNAGRDDHPCRVAFPVTGPESLAAGLRAATNAGRAARARRLVLVVGDPGPDTPDPAPLAEAFPAYRAALAECGDADPGLRHQYATGVLLRRLGLTPGVILGVGRGRAVARALRGELPVAEALAEVVTPMAPEERDAKARAVAARLLGEEPSAFRVLGDAGPGFAALGAEPHDLAGLAVTDPAGLLAAVAALYEAGVAVDWDAWYAGESRRRIELPTYSFEPTRCWPEVSPRAAAAHVDEPAARPADAERAIIGIVEDVLKVSDVGPDSDYFELGGNSILGLAVLDRINRRFGSALTLPVLYEASTASGLASLVGERPAAAGSIARLGTAGSYLPSHGQEALWFLDQYMPGLATYNVPVDLHLTGELDVAALRAAVLGLQERHEALRTRYVEVNGEPRVVLRPAGSDLDVVDLTGIPDPQRRLAEAVRRLRAAAATPMDLAAGPLYRATLIRLAADDHVLLLIAHHSVYDGWTPAVLDRDLWELYTAALADRAPVLPELPVSYMDFAAWQREQLAGPRRAELHSYWRSRLSGVVPLELPTKPRPAEQSGRGDSHRFVIPAELMSRLRVLSAAQRCTLFTTMLTAIKVLLAAYSGQDDIVVGTTTAGRSTPAVLDLIGYFNNAVPLRTGLGGDPTFREAVARVRDTVAGALAHDDLPFAMLVADLQPARTRDRHPIFQVAYIHQNVTESSGEIAPGLRYRDDREDVFGGLPPGTAKWDLCFGVIENDRRPDLPAILEYSTDLFDAADMTTMARTFVALLTEITTDPDLPLSRLTALTPPRTRRAPTPPPTRTKRPHLHAAPSPSSPLPSAGSPHHSRGATPSPFYRRGVTAGAQMILPVDNSGPVDGSVDTGGLESSLAGIWAEVLGREVGPHDDFFELGGHSLLAMVMVSKVAARHGARLPVKVVFDNPTVVRLAAVVRAAGGVAARTPVTALQPNGAEPPLFCLSPNAGNALVFGGFARSFGPGTPVYGVTASTVDDCVAAVREARAQGPYRLLGWPAVAGLTGEVAERLVADGERVEFLGLVNSIHSGQSHVFRGAGAGIDAGAGVVVVDLPVALTGPLREHAAELAAAVRAALVAPSANLPIGLPGEVAGVRGELAGVRASSGAAPGAPGAPRVGGPGDLSGRSSGAAIVRPFRLTADAAGPLGGQAELMASVAALLRRLGGEREVVLGLRQGAGEFVAVCVDTGGDPDFGELVRRTERAIRTPVTAKFAVAMEFGGGGAELGGLDVVWRVRDPGDGVRGSVVFDADKYTPRSAKRMVERWRRLVGGAAARMRLSALPVMDEAEERALVEEWNDTARDLGPEVTLPELIRRQAEATPDAEAVILGHERLSYRELDGLARRLAGVLAARGVGPESVVGVCAERSVELMVALLGVLYAGAAYLPLDPEYPAERIAYMLRDSRAGLVLTGPGAGALDAERVAVDLAELRGREPVPVVVPAVDNPAYVIYTSGSTGAPKGVVVPHRGAVNRIRWAQDADPLDTDDRVLQKTPASFDVSVWEFFWPLVAGAAVVLAGPGAHRDAFQLAELIEREAVTTLHFVPSMLRVFLMTAGPSALAGVRRVVCSGEALSVELRRELLDAGPAAVVNLYGPTEASVDVSAWNCRQPNPGTSVPIGRPIANTRLYVLDANLRPCPVGVPGELYIAGTGLARGYLNRPGLTAGRFVAAPFGPPGSRLYRTGDRCRVLDGGVIEFLGRLDDQVKLRGFRIELGEVEAVLAGHPDVAAAAVTLTEVRPGEHQLVAHLVGTETQELRAWLGERLPAHLVPSDFRWWSSLPLTPSGKLDRARLAGS